MCKYSKFQLVSNRFNLQQVQQFKFLNIQTCWIIRRHDSLQIKKIHCVANYQDMQVQYYTDQKNTDIRVGLYCESSLFILWSCQYIIVIMSKPYIYYSCLSNCDQLYIRYKIGSTLVPQDLFILATASIVMRIALCLRLEMNQKQKQTPFAVKCSFCAILLCSQRFIYFFVNMVFEETFRSLQYQ